MKRAAAAGLVLVLIFVGCLFLSNRTEAVSKELARRSNEISLLAEEGAQDGLLDDLEALWTSNRTLFSFFESKKFVSRAEELLSRIRAAEKAGDSRSLSLDAAELSAYFNHLVG